MLEKWQISIKKKFGVPSMFATRMFKKCNNTKECLEYLAKSTGDLCFSCLDYRNSQKLEELREYYSIHNSIDGFDKK